jgi:hypothetical protein
VEQPHLGVRDLSERLAVHAGDLEEGDKGEAGSEHRGGVLQRLHVLVGHLLHGL